MGDAAEQNRQNWQRLVEEWSKSGQSAASWCREHGVRYELFLYYRKCLRKRTGFTEITDGKSETGIYVEIQGAMIRIERAFDPRTLRRVVQTLGVCSA